MKIYKIKAKGEAHKVCAHSTREAIKTILAFNICKQSEIKEVKLCGSTN